jgi:hypothetical protein
MTEDCGHHEHGLKGKIAEIVSQIISATQAQNLAGIEATNDVGRAAAGVATETRADINRINGDIRLSVAESEGRIARSESDARVAIERTAGDTRGRVEANAAEIRNDVTVARSELHSTIEDRMAEMRQAVAMNSAEIMLGLERTKLEVISAKCAIERKAAETLGEIQLKAAENVALVLREAARDKFDIASKMAECCCEVKETVKEEGDRTRSLITQNIIDGLREKLEHSQRQCQNHEHGESVRINIENTLRNQNRTA